jgi:hypothetical protein
VIVIIFFLIIIIYNLNYLILSDPILGLFPGSYSYPVYVQYDMIMTCEYGYVSNMLVDLPDAYDRSDLVSTNFWSENTAIQIYFKNGFISGLGSYF